MVQSIQSYIQMEILQTITRTLEDDGKTYHVINQLKLKNGKEITAHSYYIRTKKTEITDIDDKKVISSD